MRYYPEQDLNEPEWSLKRRQILERDGHSCQSCGISQAYSRLNVHHAYYLNNHRLWEYENNSLITLCSECHSALHRFIPVKTYNNKPKFTVFEQLEDYRRTKRQYESTQRFKQEVKLKATDYSKWLILAVTVISGLVVLYGFISDTEEIYIIAGLVFLIFFFVARVVFESY